MNRGRRQMKRLSMALAIGAVPLAAGAAAALIGSTRQRRELSSAIDQLMVGVVTPAPRGGADRLESLPPPVARYLEWALPDHPDPVGFVRIGQAGTLRTDPRTERWMAFTAEHVAAPGKPAFVWNARVSVAPLLHVRVRDAFVGGRGSGHVSLMSAFTVAHDAGTPEMNSGSLHRFLAEAVWYPTALLPSAGLQWSANGQNSALATLTVDSTSVSLEFRFAETGEVTGIYTPGRWGSFEGGYQQRPWEGHFRNYERRDGVMVPTNADVGWYLDGVWQRVWQAAITSFETR